MKKILLLTIALSVFLPAYSQDITPSETPVAPEPTPKPKDDYNPVSGTENWNYLYDISTLKKGTYNIIIKGKDGAGNITYEGPFNITVDPASDMPVVRFSNPVADMRVGGNLNIVGTCADDDGTSKVFISIDDAEAVVADGKGFWSYYLKTETMADGKHTITAWGIDINGLESKKEKISFNLDRKKPVSEIDNSQNGKFVTGNVTLEGFFTDDNGIKEFLVSGDNGQTFKKETLSIEKNTGKAKFKISINTSKMENGPHVYWLKAVDSTGSQSVVPFLFFVDNQAPVVEILYPAADGTVQSKFTVVGKVTDNIGIKRMFWMGADKKENEITIIPGNPYFTFSINVTEKGTPQVTLFAEDNTGNTKEQTVKWKLDPEADLPVIKFINPTEGQSLEGSVWIAGNAKDDDGIERVELYLDADATPLIIPGKNSFVYEYKNLTAGSHVITAKVFDINQTVGKDVKVKFTVKKKGLTAKFTSVVSGAVTENWLPGMELIFDKILPRINGEINAVNKIVTADISFDAGVTAEKLTIKTGLVPGVYSFSYNLTKKISVGRKDVVLTVVDDAGNTFMYKTAFYIGKATDKSDIYFDQTWLKDGKLATVPLDGFLQGWIPGAGPISSVKLDTAVDGIQVFWEKTSFNFQITKEMLNRSVSFTVTTEGLAESLPALQPTQEEIDAAVAAGLPAPQPIPQTKPASPQMFKFTGLIFDNDVSAPVLIIESPLSDIWTKGKATLKIKTSDASGVQSVEFSIGNQNEFQPLTLTKVADGYAATKDLDVSSFDDGTIVIYVKATDARGNVGNSMAAINKDSSVPVIKQIAPKIDDALNGQVTFVFEGTDNGKLDKLLITEDGTNMVPLTGQGVYERIINLTKAPVGGKNIAVKMVDAAGNETSLRAESVFDLQKDIPIVDIRVPEDKAVVRNDFEVTGTVFDDDGIQKIIYRFDNGTYQTLEGKNNFSLPVKIADFADNEHKIEIKAVDTGGVESVPVVKSFWISKSEPVTTILSPNPELTQRGIVSITGTSVDPNGIEAVYISLDNSLTFNKAEGADKWKYTFDSQTLKDGTYSIMIKAIDKTGTEGLYTTIVNFDNHAPVLSVEEPRDGDVFSQKISLNGRAVDNVILNTLRFSLEALYTETGTSLKGTSGLPATDIAKTSVFFAEADVSKLVPGWYNLVVEATDKADNKTKISRNILIRKQESAETVEIYYPEDGERLSGKFEISGKVNSQTENSKLNLIMDNQLYATIEVGKDGFFNYLVDDGKLTTGSHIMEIATFGGTPIRSRKKTFDFSQTGPWMTIDNYDFGNFIAGRPYIKGSAGYIVPSPEEGKKAVKIPAVSVEISQDNGKTFQSVKGTEKWSYRIETGEIPDGMIFFSIRTTFKNGESVVKKIMLNVDNTPPLITILTPAENSKLNQNVLVTGTSSDNNGIDDLGVLIRGGDKSLYSVPQFIQGMFIDAHVLGSSVWEAGLGFTFFEQAVKLEVKVGMAPDAVPDSEGNVPRYTGYVLGGKLLASIYELPFDYLFGPDWEAFSTGVSIGADFSYFTRTSDFAMLFNEGLILSAVVAQWEIVKMEFDWGALNAFTLYTEGSLWFISSEVGGGIKPKIAFGLRTQIL